MLKLANKECYYINLSHSKYIDQHKQTFSSHHFCNQFQPQNKKYNVKSNDLAYFDL
jgi:hypothetical protein